MNTAADKALLTAAHSGRANACRRLLAGGADVNFRDAEVGHNALYLAAQAGHVEVCAVLLAAGARVDDAIDSGSTPLRVAAAYGFTAVCGLLLSAGANAAASDHQGTTPLYVAVMSSKLAVCRLLIEHGGDVRTANSDTWTLLHCSSHSQEVCELLLSEGAQACVHVQSIGNGYSPLDVASEFGIIEVRQLLVAHCAPLPAPTDRVKLHKLGLPAAAPAYLVAIRNAGWQRRLAATRNYVDTNGHTRGW